MTTTGAAAAAWSRGTSQLRRRWRSWLGLAVLVGFAGGVVVAAAAGARRTTTAYDRLLEDARPFDVLVGLGCAPALQDQEQACRAEAAASIDELLALAPVSDGAQGSAYLLPVVDDEGYSIQPQDEVLAGSGEAPGETCVSGSGSVEVFGSPSGRIGTELNRHRFIEGRAADPARADEVVLSVAAAREADVHVGERLRIFPIDACEGEGGSSPEEWPEPFAVTVVGLQVTPGEVRPQSGRYLQSLTVTPPLLAQIVAATGSVDSEVLVELRDDATPADLLAAADEAGLAISVDVTQQEFTADVREGLRPDALTLWLLAALGGVASLVVLGQALSRQVWAEAGELPALRAMGFTSGDLSRIGAVEGAAVAVVAGALTAALAVAASPLFPIGQARLAEPEPGIRVDALATGVGAAVVATAAFAGVVAASRWVAVRAEGARRPPPPPGRPARVPALLTHLGARPPAIVGARAALERGSGARSVPVRTGFAGIVVGVAALAGALTFDANLEHLRTTPRMVGWNWDLGFMGGIPTVGTGDGAPPGGDAGPVARAEAVLAQVRLVDGIERAGYLTVFPVSDVPLIEALPDVWAMSFSTGPGSIRPTVVSGRAPAGPDEVLVTRTVLGELGLAIGDPLEVQGGSYDGSGEPVVTRSLVTIVGTGVLPMGDGSFERVAALTVEGLLRVSPDSEPQLLVADVTPGADRQAVTAALEDLGVAGPIDARRLNPTEAAGLDVSRADDLPRLLGALMAVLALGVLLHLAYTGVRARHHELATLRALGFTRAQVITTIAWQTSLAGAFPFVVAALVGVVAGRAGWLVYAARLGVAPETVVGWLPLAGVFVAFLLAANLFGVVVGGRTRRTPPAAGLRAA